MRGITAKVVAQVLMASLLIGVGLFAAMGAGSAGPPADGPRAQPDPRGGTLDPKQLNPEDRNAFEAWAERDDLEWVPCGGDAYQNAADNLEGCEAALLYKNEKTGAEDFLIRTPPDFVWPLHWHTNQEHLVGIEGNTPITMPDGQVVDIAPGHYVYIPARLMHKAVCKAEEQCVFVLGTNVQSDFNRVTDETQFEAALAAARSEKE